MESYITKIEYLEFHQTNKISLENLTQYKPGTHTPQLPLNQVPLLFRKFI